MHARGPPHASLPSPLSCGGAIWQQQVGDAFLLSWKLCDGVLEGFSNFNDLPDEETRLQANETVRQPHPPTLTPTYYVSQGAACLPACLWLLWLLWSCGSSSSSGQIRCPPSSGKGQVSRVLTPTEMADSSLSAFLKCKVRHTHHPPPCTRTTGGRAVSA